MTSSTEYPAPLDPFRADCERCQGLCCLALAHRVEDGFPRDKELDTPCVDFDGASYRCRVFPALEERGYATCRGFECHGAGPQVARWITLPWARLPAHWARRRLSDFRRLARLRQLLAYLNARPALHGHPLRKILMEAVAGFDETGELPAADALDAHLARHEDFVRTILTAMRVHPPGARSA